MCTYKFFHEGKNNIRYSFSDVVYFWWKIFIFIPRHSTLQLRVTYVWAMQNIQTLSQPTTLNQKFCRKIVFNWASTILLPLVLAHVYISDKIGKCHSAHALLIFSFKTWFRWHLCKDLEVSNASFYSCYSVAKLFRERLRDTYITSRKRPEIPGKRTKSNSNFWKTTPSSRGFRKCMVLVSLNV